MSGLPGGLSFLCRQEEQRGTRWTPLTFAPDPQAAQAGRAERAGRLRGNCRWIAVGIEAHTKTAAEQILYNGKLLCEARELLKSDPQFGQWREKRLSWMTDETARRWMNAFRNNGEYLLQHNVGVTSVYLLTAPSVPEPAPASANTEANLAGANLAGLNVTPDAMARKMSSREIAELTGKQHFHVLRDIKELIEQGAINQSNFGLVDYTDAKGEKRPTYELDFDATMTLVTGYNAVLRAKVVRRWRELETSTAVKQAPEPVNTEANQTFAFRGQNVRTVIKDGEPWFVAKDVCDALGLRNVTRTLDRLEEDEKGFTKSNTPSGPQKYSIISESGLSAVVLKSRKPEAKPFYNWVMSEVLPALRKKSEPEPVRAEPAPEPAPEPVSEPVELKSVNTGANLAGLNVTPDAMARKMSSREIAELTGKEHFNVCRDIRTLINQGAFDLFKFEEISYRDSYGREQPEYLLDFDATMTLVTGYNAVLRAKVIRRWRELETSTAVKQAPEPAPCKTWGNTRRRCHGGRRK